VYVRTYVCVFVCCFCVVLPTWRISVFNFLRNSVFEKSLESVHCRPTGSRTNRRGRQFVTWRRAAYSVSVCCAAGTCQWWTPAKNASVTHDHRFTVLQPQLTYARVSRTDRLLQAVYSLLIIIIIFIPQGPDLQILRLSYNNAKVTIDLWQASNLQSILQRTLGFS